MISFLSHNSAKLIISNVPITRISKVAKHLKYAISFGVMQSMHSKETVEEGLRCIFIKDAKRGPLLLIGEKGLIFRKGPEYYFAHNFKECKKGIKLMLQNVP